MATYSSTEKKKNVETIEQSTKSGTPPKNRVSNASQAHAIYKKLRDDNLSIAVQRAQIQGQLDGNPPYSEAERESLGLSWLSNVNFRESASIVRSNASATWDMFNSVPSFFDLQPEFDDENYDEIEEWGQIISEEASKVLLDWEDFHYHLQMRIREMKKFGIGPVFWPDEYCWKSEAVKASNFLVPARTRSKPNIDYCCIRDEMEIGYIFDMIEMGEDAEKAGWNLAVAKKALVAKYVDGGLKDTSEEYLSSEWESIQQSIKNKDDASDKQFENIRVVHMLVEEKDSDRNVTHIVIIENDDDMDFLFYGDRRFDKMSNAVHLLLFDIGDGYMKSVRGLAYDLYPTGDISNRLTNSILDGAILSSGLILQGRTADDTGQLPITRRGPVTIVRDNLEAIQSSFAPPIEQLLGARMLVHNIQNNNSGVYKNRREETTAPERSATEARIESRRETRFENNQASWYYIQWDLFLRETLRRLMNPEYPKDHDGYDAHKKFFNRCKKRGVPNHILKFDQWTIRALRAIGMGSTNEQHDNTSWLLSIGSLLDEKGLANALRDAIGVRMGYNAVERYSRKESRNRIKTDAHSFAMLENNDLDEGREVIVGTDQLHTIHMLVHTEWVGQKIQPFIDATQLGGEYPQDISPLVQMMQVALQHMAEHIAQLERDRSRKDHAKGFSIIVKRFQDVFEDMLKVYEKQQRELQKQMEEQQAANQVNPKDVAEIESKERVAMAEIESKERVATAEARSMSIQKRAREQAQIEALIEKTTTEIQRKNAESVATIERKQRELEAKIELMRKQEAESGKS
jgi:hypothetical protein